jgi:HlyD family secretion protein
VDPSAPAIAVVRGRPDLRTALQFESIEPYVAPKASLTGSPTERVDTRVLQVIYSFRRAELPVYVGQQLDVFIEAPPVGPAS